MEAPVEFILNTSEEGGKTGFSINPAALELLRSPRYASKPVVVVSVVGQYRMGKSFLMNLLMGRTDGFPLGSKVTAETKGVWVWIAEFPNDDSKLLLLLDTEGLADPAKGSRTHDAHLFALTALLSSVMVYNTKNTIDSNSLDVLHLATELTEYISVRAGKTDGDDDDDDDSDELSRFFPTLVWAVRDHFLDLDIGDKVLTAQEYLERCLELKKGKKRATTEYNTPREVVKAFFKKRKCFLFPMPTEPENLKNLEKMTMEELKQAFLEVSEDFRRFILGHAPCKMLEGKEVTSSLFASLAENYVGAIADGGICIQSAFDYLLESENGRAVEAAVKEYKDEMDAMQLPVVAHVLNETNSAAQKKATSVFLHSAISGNDSDFGGFSDELRIRLDEAYAVKVRENHEASMQKCTHILTQLFTDVDAKLANGHFMKPGGSEVFESEVAKLRGVFTAMPETEKGPAADLALAKFEDEKISHQLSTIVQADTALQEEEKKRKMLQEEARAAEHRTKILERQKEQMKEQQQHMKQVYEDGMQQQAEEHRRQQEQVQQQMREEYEAAFKEKEELMKKGFKDKADLMQTTMDETMKEQERRAEAAQRMEQQMREQMKMVMEQMDRQRQESEQIMMQQMQRMREEAESRSGLFQFLGKVVDTVVPLVSIFRGGIGGTAASAAVGGAASGRGRGRGRNTR